MQQGDISNYAIIPLTHAILNRIVYVRAGSIGWYYRSTPENLPEHTIILTVAGPAPVKETPEEVTKLIAEKTAQTNQENKVNGI